MLCFMTELCREKERERIPRIAPAQNVVKIIRLSENSWFMVLVIGDYKKNIKIDKELLFLSNTKVFHAGHILHTQSNILS